VLSGAIRSQNSATGPTKVYRAGESFFEPPGSEHLVSENESATEPASLLAVHIADDGAHLTTTDERAPEPGVARLRRARQPRVRPWTRRHFGLRQRRGESAAAVELREGRNRADHSS